MAPAAEPSLVDLLRARADAHGDERAFTLLADGEGEAAHLRYGELDLRARAIAARLLREARPGERCLLLYGDGLEFLPAFFGCLYSGLIAVPLPLPEAGRLRRTAARLHAVAADAAPAVVLTTAPLLPLVREALAGAGGLPCVTTDGTDPGLAEGWRAPAEAGRGIAYLQYTSGSTATPKGVVISHRNVLENSERIRRAWGYGPASVSVTWVPHFHDDGLVHGLIQPLFSCFCGYLLPPAAVVQRPLRWLRAISRYRGTHAGGPNFVYALATRKVRREDCEGLDLASWQMAYNAAEPIHVETLERFARAFELFGFRWSSFYPAYGLAEATLLVTTRARDAEPALCAVRPGGLEEGQRAVPAAGGGAAKTWVGCGRAVEGTRLLIVDPVLGTRCAAGQVGEVWIAGPSVAGGYWNRPAETQETFGARPSEGAADAGEGPFLRTGDLGFLQPDGELYITGRLKDLIILRGRNHYPQDVELAAERSHPALRPGCGAAFSVELGGEERLVLVLEVEGGAAAGLDVDEVAEQVCRGVAEAHDVQVYALALLPPRTIPKTSSGKIQRRACRAELLAGQLEVVGSWRLGAEASAGPEALAPLSEALAGRPAAAPEPARSGDRVSDLLAWLRDHAEERVLSRLIDERRCIPPPLVLDFGNRGLLGLQAGPEHGGLGLGCRETLRVLEQLGAIDLTLAVFVTGHNGLGLRPIQRFAPRETRDRLLPALAAGRELAAFALTEPGAGSNPRAIAATGVPDGAGGWRLRGTKIWSGSSSWASVINVFVQLRDGAGSPAGMAGFAVRRGTPGLRSGPEALTLGLRGMVQSAVYLEDVPVGPRDLLGAPGAGLAVAQDAMAFSRLCLAAVSVGGIKRCAQLMLRYADRREIATGRLLDNPVTLTALGELTAGAAAVESLVAVAAELLDRGEELPPEAYACCKIAGPELLWQAADGLVQLLGGRGYLESNLAPQILRDARIFRIFEGPSESLRPFVGSSVLRGSGDLERFLRRLGADAAADRLVDVARQVEERCAGAAPYLADRVAGLRWAQFLVGGIAAWAALSAAAGWAARREPSARRQRIAEWARLRFEEEARQALAGAARESAAAAAGEIASRIGGFAEAIGDVEQTLPGEDHEVDPLLRRGLARATVLPLGAGSRGPAEPFAPALPVGPAGPATEEPRPPWTSPASGPGAEPVRGWILRWLAEEVGLDPQAVNTSKPFSSLGLDSVTGLRMASELQGWLGRPLEATLVWDYPTIDLLAAHLAAEPPVREVPGDRLPSDPMEEEAELLLRRIAALSEEDALRLLKQELGGMS